MSTTWDSLVQAFDRDGLTRDAPVLISLIRSVLDAPDTLARASSIAELSNGVSRLGLARQVLVALAVSTDAVVRRLALDLVSRLPPPLDLVCIPSVTPLLRDRRMPSAVLLGAAAALIRAAGRNRKVCARVWADFAEGYGKRSVLNDQRELRKRFEKPRMFDHFCTALRRRMPLRCPRCHARVASAKMPQHLWKKHGRLLARGRVQKPWQFLDAVQPDTDPSDRLDEMYRLMRRHRLGEVAILDHLCASAASAGRGLCPRCWATVPVESSPRPCDVVGGRVSGHGYSIEVTDGLWRPRLSVTSPIAWLYAGPEPDSHLSPAAQRAVAVLPLVLAAFVLAAMLPSKIALFATASCLMVALVLHRSIATRTDRPRGDRAIDHAWQFLAFDPNRGRIPAHDADFLAGLAMASIGRGNPIAREAIVRQWAAALDPALTHAWAAFHVLEAADAVAIGGDPVPRMAEALGSAFDESRPLAAIAALAALTPCRDWPDDRRARLQVLVLERAFSAGLRVWDLHELGRALPALGNVLGADDPDRLARLHRIWELQTSRPWAKCGPAATAFELAHYPDLSSERFGEASDLLLYLPMRCDGQAESLILCGRGILFRRKLMTGRSVPISIRPRLNSEGGGYELSFGTGRLAFTELPNEIVPRLECWADYWFGEFGPHVGDSLEMPAGTRVARLVKPLSTACTNCGVSCIPRLGALGLRES